MPGTPFPKIFVRRVEVFGKGAHQRQKCLFLLTPEQARDLCDTKQARRVSKYRIELTQEGELAIKARFIQLNDRSCKPGQWLLDGVVVGNKVDRAICDAWRPQFRTVSA